MKLAILGPMFILVGFIAGMESSGCGVERRCRCRLLESFLRKEGVKDMKKDRNLIKAGRLAFRVEGHMWVAYYAQPHTMDDAIVLGSIAMRLVTDNLERKNAFMQMMQEATSEMLKKVIDPTISRSWSLQWDEPHPAPESEREDDDVVLLSGGF